jgi:hypothetical protein
LILNRRPLSLDFRCLRVLAETGKVQARGRDLPSRVFWRGLLVCAIDGTMMCCPDTEANLRVFRRGGGSHGGTGCPMVRLLALVACGTRRIIDVTFGSTSVGETT